MRRRVVIASLRWKLWGLASRLPGVCPSNAHTVIVCAHPDRNRNPFIDGACRRDCAAVGFCWCGKLRQPPTAGGPQ
jgi:hypothetical protein